MTDEEPRISVIIPVYNPGMALYASTRSVLQQSHRNLELLLVDDGSTDGSSARCQEIAEADERVVVLHQPNSGVSSARNTGIAHATGDYLTFVDADDLLEPDALRIVMQRLAETDAELICFGMTFVSHNGPRIVDESVKAVKHDMLLESPAALRKHFFDLFRQNYLSSVCNKLYRTSFVNHSKLQFNAQMAILEDFEFVVSSLSRAPRIQVLAEPLYQYRIDLNQRASSRRPDIDYLRNFRWLEQSLERFSAVVDLSSPEELEELNAMVFRFYLIGLEMLIARRTVPWSRFIRARQYMSDAHFVQAARATGSMRSGVSVIAKLIVGQHAPAAFILLLAWKWIRRAERRFRIFASRTALVGRR